MNQRDRDAAEFVEWVVMPLLVAFAVGLLLGLHRTEQQDLAAARAIDQARLQVRQAHALLQQWDNACGPLLTLPPAAAPMVIPAAGQQPSPAAADDAVAAALQWGAAR